MDIYLSFRVPLRWPHGEDKDEGTLIIVLQEITVSKRERDKPSGRCMVSVGALLCCPDELWERRDSRDPYVEESGAKTEQMWVEVTFWSPGTLEKLGKSCFLTVA